MRKKDTLEYEFLPAALEITETPASPLGHTVLWTIVALLLVAFLWAWFGRVDEVAIARGKVVPDGKVKVVQAAAQGVISSIEVKDGQKVTKDQVLVRLDSSLANTSVAGLEESLKIAELERDVTKALASGQNTGSIINAADVPDEIKSDLLAMTNSRTSADQIKRQFLVLALSQAQATYDSVQKSINDLSSTLEASQADLANLQAQLAAAKEEDKSKLQAQFSQKVYEVGVIRSQLQSQQPQLSSAKSTLDTARMNLNSFDKEGASTHYSSAVDQDKKITELENQLDKARQSSDQLSIKSPVDGLVQSVAVNTIGGIVSPGQAVMTIVPSGTPLIVEASVLNRDIGFVKQNQTVELKFDTFPFQQYGTVEGRVESISPDAVDDDKQGSVYKARMSFKPVERSEDSLFHTSPGMTVGAEVKTGERRILDFFLDPLIKNTSESLKLR